MEYNINFKCYLCNIYISNGESNDWLSRFIMWYFFGCYLYLVLHDFHTQHGFASQSVRKANVCYNYKEIILNMYYKPTG